MNGYEIGQYKFEIIKKLIADGEIVKLLDPDGYCDYPDDLIYRNIFPYTRIPATEQEVMTYITIAVSVPQLDARNDFIRNMRIILRVYSHSDIMKVQGEVSDRIDLVSAAVDRILNESMDLGIGYVKLVSNTEHVLDNVHHYRELVFKTDDINAKRRGAKQWSM